jgi:IS5 family transposase
VVSDKQHGFSVYKLTTAKKQTKPEMVLTEMEAVVPRQALIELHSMRRFSGINLFNDRIPDKTTILSFRHLLEKHQLGEQLYGFE